MLTYNEQKPLPHSQGLGQETILCQHVFNSKEHADYLWSVELPILTHLHVHIFKYEYTSSL